MSARTAHEPRGVHSRVLATPVSGYRTRSGVSPGVRHSSEWQTPAMRRVRRRSSAPEPYHQVMNEDIQPIGPAIAASLSALNASSAESASAEGTWGEEGDRLPQLVLEAGGRLHGTDGCNRLVGGWTQDGAVVDFGQVASTMMYCADVDTWLAAMATGEVNGDALTILDRDGNEIGTLARQ